MNDFNLIPTKLDFEHMDKHTWVKARTQELYDMLPQTSLEDRNTYTTIRDEIIELNYSFFGYVARSKYVSDPHVTYEDKLQSALLNFCQMWAKYKYAAEYRTDLSFAVFFKPRLSECISREFNPIKYSLRRTICKKAADQLGKHWGEVVREDLAKVNLPPNEMQILEAIFNTQYNVSFEEIVTADFMVDPNSAFNSDFIDSVYTEDYDSLEDLIVHEMIERESLLSDSDLKKMAELYTVPLEDLIDARPIGEAKLKSRLEDAMEMSEAFTPIAEYEHKMVTNNYEDI